MSKAFDKVNHGCLLQKLHEFGFRGSVLQWFSSYLMGRYQLATVLGETSYPLPVSSGFIYLTQIQLTVSVLLKFGQGARSASCSNVHSYGCWQLPPQLHKPVHAKLAFMHLHLPLHDALNPLRMSW